MTIFGCFFGSFWYISEELFLRKIEASGTLGVSNEGGWGLVIYAILLPILNNVNDPFNEG